MKPKHICRQRGITLLESLVAIVVVALGLLGILGVQLRTLADTRTSVNRVQAVRLVEDLAERLRVQPNALGNLDSYTFEWVSANQPIPAPEVNCSTSSCTAAQLTGYDLHEWRTRVRDSLPMGNAKVFIAAGETDTNNRRQLGVMISWHENERAASNAADAADYKNPIDAATATAAGGISGVSCPANNTCQLEYIPIGARCDMRGDIVKEYSCPVPTP